jgi:hypothetical protein
VLDGSLLGSDDGSLLGCDDGSLLGSDDGSLLGCDDGSLLGSDDGSLLGSDDGSLLGCDDGSLLGCDDGSMLGCDDGSAPKSAETGLEAFVSAGEAAPVIFRKKFFSAANMAGPYQTKASIGKKVSAFETTIFYPQTPDSYPNRSRSIGGSREIPLAHAGQR